jgi:hypothetical protein
MLRRPILPPSEPDILKSCTFRSSQVHAHSRDSVCRLRVSCVSPPDFAGVNSVVAGFKPEGFSLYWKIKIQIWAFLRFLAVFCPRWTSCRDNFGQPFGGLLPRIGYWFLSVWIYLEVTV